jgi:hypothetical protein
MATGKQTKPQFLVERTPAELAENLRKSDIFVARVFFLIMLLACWLPLLATLLAGKLEIATALLHVTLIIVISTFLAIFLIAIGRYARNSWTGSNVPVVEYCDETLTLRSRRGRIIAKVEECHFWVGPVHHMTLGMADYMIATPFLKNRFAPLADRDLILIEILPL